MKKIMIIKYIIVHLIFLLSIFAYFRFVYNEIKNINDLNKVKNHPYVLKIIDKKDIKNIYFKFGNFIVDNNGKILILYDKKVIIFDSSKSKKYFEFLLLIYFLIIFILIVYDYFNYLDYKRMRLYKIYEKEHYITDKILHFLTFSLSHKLNSPLKIVERSVFKNCEENKEKILNAISEIKETILSMNSYYEWYHKLYSLFHIFYIAKSIISIFEEEVDVRIILDSELKKYKFASPMMTDKMFLFLMILIFNFLIKVLSTKIQVFVGKYDEKNGKLEVFIFSDGNNITDMNLIEDSNLNEFEDIINILRYSKISVNTFYNYEQGFNVIVLILDVEKIIGE